MYTKLSAIKRFITITKTGFFIPCHFSSVLPSVQHSITNISSESAVVHWKSTGPSSDISYYRVLLRADAGPLVFQLNSTSVKLEQLRHGTYYEVQVQAVTPAGSGAPSNTTVFRTGNGIVGGGEGEGGSVD